MPNFSFCLQVTGQTFPFPMTLIKRKLTWRIEITVEEVTKDFKEQGAVDLAAPVTNRWGTDMGDQSKTPLHLHEQHLEGKWDSMEAPDMSKKGQVMRTSTGGPDKSAPAEHKEGRKRAVQNFSHGSRRRHSLKAEQARFLESPKHITPFPFGIQRAVFEVKQAYNVCDSVTVGKTVFV